MSLTKVQKDVIRANLGLTDAELLNWAMHQLLRASWELALLTPIASKNPKSESIAGQGCECTAKVILKRLVKSKEGYEMVRQTSPRMVRGYKKPI